MSTPSPPKTTRKPTTLHPPQRHITTHNPTTGKSTFHPASSQAQLYFGADGIGGMARSYAVPSVPVPNMVDDADVAEYLSTDPHVSTSYLRREIVQGNGTGANLLVVDIAPGGESQMHRTVSLDFSVCVAGRIWCELDSGERVELGPGDHVIQRGTMHKWINASATEPARFMGMTLPCVPFEIPGTAIGSSVGGAGHGKMLTEEHLAGTGRRRRDGSRL